MPSAFVVRSAAVRFVLSAMLVLSTLLAGSAFAQGIEGQKAPALKLKDPSGVERSLPELAEGRPTVVLFWASWCPYCKALMPHVQSMIDEFGSHRIEVVAVNLWEDGPNDWRADFVSNGYDFKVLLAGDEAAKLWGVKGTPGLFLIDRQGKVAFDRNSRQFKPARRDQSLLEGDLNNRAKAARQAPLWAAELRKAVRASLATP